MGQRRTSCAASASVIGRAPTATALFAILLGALSGCGGPATVPTVVFVRDAETSAPVVGATLIAQSMARDHPLSIDTLFGRTGSSEQRRTTDDLGRVQVALVEDRLTRVTVLPSERGSTVSEGAAAREPAFINIASASPGADHWDRWLPLISLRGRPLEIKLERADGR